MHPFGLTSTDALPGVTRPSLSREARPHRIEHARRLADAHPPEGSRQDSKTDAAACDERDDIAADTMTEQDAGEFGDSESGPACYRRSDGHPDIGLRHAASVEAF